MIQLVNLNKIEFINGLSKYKVDDFKRNLIEYRERGLLKNTEDYYSFDNKDRITSNKEFKDKINNQILNKRKDYINNGPVLLTEEYKSFASYFIYCSADIFSIMVYTDIEKEHVYELFRVDSNGNVVTFFESPYQPKETSLKSIFIGELDPYDVHVCDNITEIIDQYIDCFIEYIAEEIDIARNKKIKAEAKKHYDMLKGYIKLKEQIELTGNKDWYIIKTEHIDFIKYDKVKYYMEEDFGFNLFMWDIHRGYMIFERNIYDTYIKNQSDERFFNAELSTQATNKEFDLLLEDIKKYGEKYSFDNVKSDIELIDSIKYNDTKPISEKLQSYIND